MLALGSEMKSSSLSPVVKYLHFLDHFSTRFALIAYALGKTSEALSRATNFFELFYTAIVKSYTGSR